MDKANRYAIEINIAAWAGGLCCLVLAALAVVPLRTIEALPGFCPFRRLLGIECYGCGMTRALCALLHGQVDTALHYNRGVWIIAAVMLMLALFAIARLAILRTRQMAMRQLGPEFKLAFAISWVIATIVTTGCAVAPYMLDEGRIAHMTPRCESMSKLGRPCFFCGMTTAFIDIAHGRLREAGRANRGSLPLYAGFVCNGVLAAGFLFKERRGC